MPSVLRKPWVVGVGVVILLALVLLVVWLNFSQQSFPQTSGTITVKGITAPVEITRDSKGIPHIYAQTTQDLFFAEGYTHAQERFWQMEFQRRVGSARLSELLDSTTLDTDIYLRTLGYRHLAEQEYAQVSPQAKLILDSYSAGVNAYISGRKPEELGLEFAFLKLQGVNDPIEPWTPVDSLVWGHMMVYDQSDKLSYELDNLDKLMAVGQTMAADLRPPYRQGRPVIVPDEELGATGQPVQSSAFSPADLNLIAGLGPQIEAMGSSPQLADFISPLHGASNSWAISGKLTASGKPLLSNDPHMSINMPSIWYEVDLHCVKKSPDCIWNMEGYSLPGVPGILLGHNDRIAWGFTNAEFDSQDVYIEHVNPQNVNQYEVNGKWVDMDIRREEIKVLGQDQPTVLLVRSTRHGPIISDQLKTGRAGYTVGDNGPNLLALSVQSTDLRPMRTIEAVLNLDRAQNWNDFREALKQFDAGTQNIIYADVDGNIGYQLPGLIPIRAKGDGTLPVPGWNDDYAWTGFIPYDDLPREYNPAQGFIATSNNPQVTSKYPYFLGTEEDYGFREQRIVDLINQNKGKITIDTIKAMQRDAMSLSALETIPYLKDLQLGDARYTAARDRLLKWNGQMDATSPDAALYNYFWRELIADTFHDQLPQNEWPAGDDNTAEIMYHLLQNKQSPWWDDITTPTVETRDDILVKAFKAGVDDGIKDQGATIDNWQWGKMHTISFENAVLGHSGIGVIESMFNRGPYPAGGGQSVIDKIDWDATAGFEASSAPAMREIVDLGNLNNSLMIFSGGESGHPFDAHYDDFIQKWLNFEYNPALWDKDKVDADAQARLTLSPGS